MEYSKGTLGRVFLARLQDGDSIYDAVTEIATKENVRVGAVWAMGGMRSGKVVTGPESPHGTVVPIVNEFDDARELVGFGTLVWIEDKPSLHFHGGIGNHEEVMIGCPRIAMSTYLVLEVVIIELLGIEATRIMDPEYGVHALSLIRPTGDI